MALPTVVDLFCGAGGLSKGFETASFKILLGVDHCKDCCKTFASNHKKTEVICDDIRRVSIGRIREAIGNSAVDVVIGGPPCQGFSMAGRRDPHDPRNSLFREFVRLVDGLQPKWVLMENVTGLLVMTTSKGKDVSDIIENELKKTGYEVQRRILLAADYGVPQKRKRVFFMGNRDGVPVSWPRPTHSSIPEQTSLDGSSPKKWVSVDHVLLPKEKVGKTYFRSKRMIEGFRNRKARNLANNKGFGWQILRLDEPSFTLSARYWKDGSDALVKYSENEIRMLTERECARVQSFSDDYEFFGSKREVYKQIGNAVPPLLAKALASEISKRLVAPKLA